MDSKFGVLPQNVVLCFQDPKNKMSAEDHSNNIILRSCINKNGDFENPTPEKLLKCLGEEIKSIQSQSDEDSFLSEKMYKSNVCASIKPSDVKDGIATAIEIMGMLKALDSAMSDLFGFSVKDLLDWGKNKLQNPEDTKQTEQNKVQEMSDFAIEA